MKRKIELASVIQALTVAEHVRRAAETLRVKLRTGQRAVEKRVPFHKDKNSIGDAILIEIYRDVLSAGGDVTNFAFVTHNKHDFPDLAGDGREPQLTCSGSWEFHLCVGRWRGVERLRTGLVEEVKWEFEYQVEPRLISEIMEAERLPFRQVWYNREGNLRVAIESGKLKVVNLRKALNERMYSGMPSTAA